MFVLVNTYFDYDSVSDTTTREVGAVYGPYTSKEEAEGERDRMEFPNPEQVFVRALHS